MEGSRLRLGRQLLFESVLIALAAFGADLASTLYGLSVGLREENPMSHVFGFPAFIVLSLTVQLVATITVSLTWLSFNGHWRVGYMICSAPRFLIALMNVQKALLAY